MGFSWVSSRIPWNIRSEYLASGMPSPDQNVRLFGEVEAARRQAEVIPALRILEPRLQRLALVPLANSPPLHLSGPILSGTVSSGIMSVRICLAPHSWSGGCCLDH
jgi:hypothetical protein